VNNSQQLQLTEVKLLVRQTVADIRRPVETNLLGAIHTTRAALPHMIRQRAGLMVFHSSVAAVQPRPGLAAYAAAKAGLESFARSVALEYRKRGIRTVCLRLGPFRTDMYSRVPEGEQRYIAERILAGRVPGPEAVARCVTALMVSEDSVLDGCVVSLDSDYSLGGD
jgi:3-oxoacyl-[acyl-carrier protein] reductase